MTDAYEYGTCDICSTPLDPRDVNYKASHGAIVCSLACVHEAEASSGRSREHWEDIWEALDPENLEGQHGQD